MNRIQKTIMMIGGGIQEINAVRVAQSAGYKVLVTDRNSNAPCFSSADYFAIIDGRDIEGLIAHAFLNKEKLNIVGVFTLTELVTSVSAVAVACGFPGVPLESAVACQNKLICKQLWLTKNIPTPRGQIIYTAREGKVLFNELNQQVFVKPIVGFGGIGAQRIISEHMIDEIFCEDFGGEILMEELITGSMHDVNGVIDESNKFWPMGIVDRAFLTDYPVEKEISTPSVLSVSKQKELYDLLESAVRALGIKWGPIKGDAVLFNNKFYMLEVAPRLHGPKSSLYLLPLSGLNCLEKVLGIISGDLNNNLTIDQSQYSICSAVMPDLGTIFYERAVVQSKKIEGIEQTLIFATNGSTISEYKNSTHVPAYIIAVGKSLKDCKTKLLSTGLIKEKI